MAKNILSDYSVPVKATVEGTIAIRAANLDDAFQRAKEVKLKDFIEINGELWESSFEVNGVYKS